jgi:Zn-dependent protease
VSGSPPRPRSCARCGTELAETLFRCPSCGTLVHAEALGRLADQAGQAETAGDFSLALNHWNQVLGLLPPDAPQHAVVTARVANLDRQLHAGSPASTSAGSRPRPSGMRGAWIAVITAIVFLTSKAKFLLLGFTKLGTLLSMVAFFGVYWGTYGWKFALGLVLSIYVHEMGHIAALRHYGIPASAPMFIPGLGAFVRLKAHPPTRGQDARVGLAGPVWGTGAAIAAFGLFQLTGDGLYASIVHVGAVINLFNLIPVWQLDGARGITPLARHERLILLAIVIAAFALFHEGILVLVALVLGLRCFTRDQGEGDQAVLLQFALLVLALGLLSTVRLPTPGS